MDLFRNDILEIIFERKNKKYGAYALRIHYPQVVTRSGLISILAFILLMSSPMIAKYFKEDKEIAKAEKKKRTKADFMVPPPLDAAKPPPPVIPPPPKLKMQQFTPPKIVEDEKIDEKHQIEENKDLKTANAITQDGETNIVIPDNIEVTQQVVEEKILSEKEVDEVASLRIKNLSDYLSNEIEYPEYEKSAGIQGKVYVTLVVEPDGSLSFIKIRNGVSPGLDSEALRVMNKIKSAGSWNPAKKNGKPVRFQYVLPINYEIEE